MPACSNLSVRKHWLTNWFFRVKAQKLKNLRIILSRSNTPSLFYINKLQCRLLALPTVPSQKNQQRKIFCVFSWWSRFLDRLNPLKRKNSIEGSNESFSPHNTFLFNEPKMPISLLQGKVAQWIKRSEESYLYIWALPLPPALGKPAIFYKLCSSLNCKLLKKFRSCSLTWIRFNWPYQASVHCSKQCRQ